MTEDRSPLTPQQIREQLEARIYGLANRGDDICVEFKACPLGSVSCDVCGYRAEVHQLRDALTLCDSQALALTQQEQEIEMLRNGRVMLVERTAEQIAALTAERDALKRALDKAAGGSYDFARFLASDKVEHDPR